jgi:predicted dehydrogenase
MTDSPTPSLDYLPRLPRRKDFRIGCAGAGFIMRDCHLVAYRQAGFNPVAIASRTVGRAEETARRHSIPRVHATIADLHADPEIEVLDIAVPPHVQPGVIREAVRHKHIRGILAQKPLAMSVSEAKECVALCDAAGVTLAVNQNMRYDQSVRAMKYLLRRGWLGEIVLATIDMRAIPHWMPWSEKLPSLSTFVMSIHHLEMLQHRGGRQERFWHEQQRDGVIVRSHHPLRGAENAARLLVARFERELYRDRAPGGLSALAMRGAGKCVARNARPR